MPFGPLGSKGRSWVRPPPTLTRYDSEVGGTSPADTPIPTNNPMTKYTLDQLHASETLPCTRCDGTGNSRSGRPCPFCDGRGRFGRPDVTFLSI
jgi:RecJ-like exonuclease